jgi:hypothetical protein
MADDYPLMINRGVVTDRNVTIHPCESNLNQGLPQIAQISQMQILSILSTSTKQSIEDRYQSVIIGEICGKKAFLGAE